MIPQRLSAVLRNRKRNAADRAFNAIDDPFGCGMRMRRVAEDIFIDPIGRCSRAMRRVDVHSVIGIFLEQLPRTLRQLVGIFLVILRRDRKERLFTGKRIRPGCTFPVAGRNDGVAAGPRRDGARRVAGALRTDRSQCGFQGQRVPVGHTGTRGRANAARDQKRPKQFGNAHGPTHALLRALYRRPCYSLFFQREA